MVIPPMIIPVAPNPIAKIKNFLFSIIIPLQLELYAFNIDNVPSNASSRRTVSVA
jgi:hypothetical protein